MANNFKLVLSRTDSIGDVILTLPMAGLIKQKYPHCRICFLGRTYTKEIVALSRFVDEFINYDEISKLDLPSRIQFMKEVDADIFLHVFPLKKIAVLAKKAKVPLRVGTTNRIYHWFTCNKLLRLSRKNSPLHEAQLNARFLGFLNVDTNIPLEEIRKFYGFANIPVLDEKYKTLLDKNRQNIILHPRSKGSAKEWGLVNFKSLVAVLPRDKFNIFISGTEQDAKLMLEFLEEVKNNVTDLTGKLSLEQFIAFISSCDALVAASTGPLHIAAALGKRAIGLFSPRRPIHPGRWMPLGEKADYVVYDEACPKCKGKQECECITKIKPEKVLALLLQNNESV